MRLNKKLNKNDFNLDFKTLRDVELRTVAGSTFQTVAAEQRKARFISSVFLEGTLGSSRDDQGQNPLHQFPRSKSATSWRGQKSVVSK